MIAVLDDDPTGSQTVHGATIVTALDELADDPLTFYLTNTRAMEEDQAVALTYDLARQMPGAIEVSTSAFADQIIKGMS